MKTDFSLAMRPGTLATLTLLSILAAPPAFALQDGASIRLAAPSLEAAGDVDGPGSVAGRIADPVGSPASRPAAAGQAPSASYLVAQAPSAGVPAATDGTVLRAGEAMDVGKRYLSPSGTYFATLNPDGNLVVARASDGGFIWGLNTVPGVDYRRVERAEMTPEGRLVLSDASGATVWSVPDGYAVRNSRLSIGDDGVLRIETPDPLTPIQWASAVEGKLPIEPGQSLPRDVRHRAGDHYLVLNPDGNLVVARSADMGFVWGLNLLPEVPFRDIDAVTMRPDGRLVATRADGSVVWQRPIDGAAPGSKANVSPEGVLYIERPDGSVAWSSDPAFAAARQPQQTQQAQQAPQPSTNQPAQAAQTPASDGLTAAAALPLRGNQYFEVGKKYPNEAGDRYVRFPEDGNLALHKAADDKYYGGLHNYLPSGEWKRAKRAGLNASGNFALWDAEGNEIYATDIRGTGPDARMEMTDDGDLVIRDGAGRIRWSLTGRALPNYPADRAANLPADARKTPNPMDLALLERHNELRARHGVPPLSWSPALAHEAQQWANSCGPQKHASPAVRKGAGENLAAFSDLALLTDPKRMADRAQAWYDEIKAYNFNDPGYNRRGDSQELQTGHFTQWVWKETTEIGCAAAACPSSRYPGWLVCRYFPPGNVGSSSPADTAANFRKNVPPLVP